MSDVNIVSKLKPNLVQSQFLLSLADQICTINGHLIQLNMLRKLDATNYMHVHTSCILQCVWFDCKTFALRRIRKTAQNSNIFGSHDVTFQFTFNSDWLSNIIYCKLSCEKRSRNGVTILFLENEKVREGT